MKFIFKKIFLLNLLIGIIFILIITTNKTFATASFTKIRTDVTNLGYGITLEHIIGTSKSTFNSQTTREDRYQSIYTASISKESQARVVQWSYFTGKAENGFGISTLERIAANYEQTHKGEKVIVATNNWLSDTQSGNVGEFDAPQVSDGLNYRVSDAQGSSERPVFSHDYIPRTNFLGFDRSGKVAYYSDDFQNGNCYTKSLYLSFYNGTDTDRTLLNIEVAKINEEPADGEVAIYFSNYSKSKLTFDNAKIYQFKGLTTRHDNLDTGETDRSAFAKGTFTKMANELNFDYNDSNVGFYTYYFVSKNAEFDKLDFTDKIVICQHELLGEFANVLGGTTYYYHIVRNGVPYNNNYNNDEEGCVSWAKGHQINNEVHPRTAFVIKEDGTFALSVIDGRSKKINDFDKNAEGMDYQDMAWFYTQEYNAKEVFNYDGGGSSCMVVWNGEEFEIVNTPTDGHERGVANATLIVVDKEDYELEKEITDTSITLKVNNLASTITNLSFTLNGETKKLENNSVTFNNLTKQTSYSITTSYTKDSTIYDGQTINFETTKELPKLKEFSYESKRQDTILAYLTLEDPDNIFIGGEAFIKESTTKGYELKIGEEIELTFEGLISNTEYDLVINIYSKNTDGKQYKNTYTQKVKTKEAKFPDSIEIDIDKYIVKVGETAKIKVTPTPENTYSIYTYTSSDDEIISISDTGKITALKEGKVTIYVSTKEKNAQAECVFTVSNDDLNKKSGCNSSTILIYMSTAILCLFVFKRRKY